MTQLGELMEKAIQARKNAYTPYSKFPVGAALVCGSNKIYTGCNIENAAYSLGCCAERVAIFKAISDGEKMFKELVVTADTERPIPPCGACRQVMSEFFDSSTMIHMTNLKREVKTITMDKLLPFSFSSNDLNE